MTTDNAPASMYRTTEGLGVWEHKGKVAAVGIGHSPTARRWDGRHETSVGANSILALRRAIEDAGVTPDQVDGLVLAPVNTTWAHWLEGTPPPLAVVHPLIPPCQPLGGPLPDLRRDQLVLRVHQLGPRPLSEFLKELVGNDDGLQADALFLLEKYAALDSGIVRALGGDTFPPAIFPVGPT